MNQIIRLWYNRNLSY